MPGSFGKNVRGEDGATAFIIDSNYSGLYAHNDDNKNPIPPGSPGGSGVFGETVVSGGAGVFGANNGPKGVGVQGNGPDAGVNGFSDQGAGIRGISNHANGAEGLAHDPNGTGVLAINFATTAPTASDGSPNGCGVLGVTTVPTAAGVFGANNDLNQGVGVQGNGPEAGVSGFSNNGVGVRGESIQGSGLWGESQQRAGVWGVSHSQQGEGVAGINDSPQGGIGVVGHSQQGTGVHGTSLASPPLAPSYLPSKEHFLPYLPAGVWGESSSTPGVQGTSDSGNGVYGASNSGAGGYFLGNNGLYAEGDTFAALFSGFVRCYNDVQIIGNLTKSRGGFRIDHPFDPANKYLNHSFVESSERKNIYDGIVQLDSQGEAVVELPEWLEATNDHFRYQLTALEAPAPDLHIAQTIAHNRFKIAGGRPGQEVSWQVTGNRRDPVARAHPLIVEEEKLAPEQGRYLHPELYGQPPELGIAQPPKRPNEPAPKQS